MQRLLFTMVGSLVVLAVLALAGCSTAPKTTTGRQILSEKVVITTADFKQNDSSMSSRFDEAYGYAVFPEVTKGGAGLGGAGGRFQTNVPDNGDGGVVENVGVSGDKQVRDAVVVGEHELSVSVVRHEMGAEGLRRADASVGTGDEPVCALDHAARERLSNR